MNFRYRLMQFMSGRYGPDRFFYILFGVAMALSVINIFLRSLILQLIIYGITVYALIRLFSRNIPARRRENDFFTEKINFFKRRREFRERCRADKFHIYKKCPRCKAILKLPHRVGTHTTACPKCGNEFKVRVRK